MKIPVLFFAFGLSWLAIECADAQAPDHAQYNKDVTQCDEKRQKVIGKLSAVRAEKETALRELQQGYFCSKCRNSKTSIEKGGENFEAHLGRVKGERVPATQAEIAENQNRFQDKMKSLYAERDAADQECARLTTAYMNARQAAEDHAKQDAQRAAQHDADARAQHEADEKQRLLAAQQAQQEQERQAREAERQRREEAERVRQAQLAANILRFQDRINSNNADTQAKLDEHRQNSTLSGVPTYDRSTAQGTIASTNSGALRRQAFGEGDYLNSGSDYAQEKANSLFNKVKENFIEKKLRSFFGEPPLTEDEERENSPITHIKKEIASDAIHYIKDKFMQSAPAKLQELNQRYERAKAEYASYDAVSLTQTNKEVMDYISRGADVIMGNGDSASFDAYSKDFWTRVPKRFLVGVPRYYLPGPKPALIKEISGNIANY